MNDDLYRTGIRPLLDDFLLKKMNDQPYPDYWRGSSAGYCHRYVIMKRLHVPPVPELAELVSAARQTRVFEAGHIFHEWMNNVLEGVGVSIGAEQEVQDHDLDVVGHYDELVKIDGHIILYDYKTANSSAFDYPKTDLNTGWKMQLGTYMRILRAEGIKVNEGRVLQIEKDTLRMREFQLFWTDSLDAEVENYWKELERKWQHYKKTGELPPCQCGQIDGGWFGKRSKKGKIYNDFYYRDVPCSEEWYLMWKADKLNQEGV